MATPKNKAVKVVRIADKPEIATENINDAIVEIEKAQGSNVVVEALWSDTVILAYVPKGDEGGNPPDDDGGNPPDDDGGNPPDDDGGNPPDDDGGNPPEDPPNNPPEDPPNNP
jgi:hypothetical protein